MQLLESNTKAVTMTSREIAVLTEKRHDHVMRDITSMLEQLHGDGGVPTFGGTYVNEQNGQTYPMFRLPYDETICLLTGYDVKARMKVIKRWQELEQPTVAHAPALPPMTLAEKHRQLKVAQDIMADESLKNMFPLVWQQVSDGVQNDIVAMFGGKPLLGNTQQVPLDIVEIAKLAGITIPQNRKGAIGKSIKAQSSTPAVQVQRVINGSIRQANAYTNHDEILGLIRKLV